MTHQRPRGGPASLRVASLDRARGLDSRHRYRDLLESQRDPRERIRETQSSKLRALLDAARQVPYYRGLLRESDDPWATLASLPILTRESARANADALYSRDPRIRKDARPKATGGSTGEPLRYAISGAAQSEQWAQLWRAWNVTGYEPGAPLGIVAGRSLLAGQGLRRAVYAWLQNWTTLDAFSLDEAAMARFARTLVRRRVRHLYGYASALEVFARWLEAARVELPLRAVFATAEQLLPATRSAIERGTRAEVFDTYGANDGGIFAFECEAHEGLHLGEERCLVEIVREDGSAAPPGEVGRVITTDLENRAFPFIRYDVGDLAAINPRPCLCGRTLLRLTSLSGRATDVVVLLDGRRVHGELFSHLFRDEPAVRRYQAVQLSVRAIEVRLSVDPSLDTQGLERLRARLGSLLEGSDVTVIVTDTFEHTDAGKVPLVINRAGPR